MTQIAIISGIYADQSGDYRTSYPENLIPVPKAQGVSNGYLRPADGIASDGTGPGIGRGGINWNGVLHRVMGSKLVRIDAAGAVTELADIPGAEVVTLDYGFDRLGISAGGSLHYWNGSALTTVTDPDAGTVLDHCWIGGYYLLTDGANLIVTELNDPTAINPLKYGSAESDPDPIKAVDALRNEAYALGRYTIEAFQNISGDLFPFRRIDGAQVPRGVIGTHAYAPFAGTFAFLGSGRNESPAVYLMQPGDTLKLSTREIDTILGEFTEAQLAAAVVEARTDKSHQHLLIHLPDRCLVYDAAASQQMQQPIWFVLHSGVSDLAQYRASGLVWCYDRWNVEDPTSSAFGHFVGNVSSHYGQAVGWRFGTAMAYNGGADGIVHDLELVCLPGRAALGVNPTVWHSHSADGVTWSQERPKAAGKQGERAKRLAWRRAGRIQHVRMERFRGTSDAQLSMARLEAQIEALGAVNG
jgi:hypothetical protein